MIHFSELVFSLAEMARMQSSRNNALNVYHQWQLYVCVSVFQWKTLLLNWGVASHVNTHIPAVFSLPPLSLCFYFTVDFTWGCASEKRKKKKKRSSSTCDWIWDFVLKNCECDSWTGSFHVVSEDVVPYSCVILLNVSSAVPVCSLSVCICTLTFFYREKKKEKKKKKLTCICCFLGSHFTSPTVTTE